MLYAVTTTEPAFGIDKPLCVWFITDNFFSQNVCTMLLKIVYLTSFWHYIIPVTRLEPYWISFPRLTLVYWRGVGYHPLRIIFRPTKTLNFTIKWVELIVRPSFPVILAQKFLLPYPGVGVG